MPLGNHERGHFKAAGFPLWWPAHLREATALTRSGICLTLAKQMPLCDRRVQAIATMAFGLFTGKPADIIVGPGNAWWPKPSAALWADRNRCFRRPTESMVIADKTADPVVVAVDLVSQAEHASTPRYGWLPIQKSWAKSDGNHAEVINDLPHRNRLVGMERLREVILCRDREEIAEVSDEYAAEHVQVITEDPDWYLQKLENYGRFFSRSVHRCVWDKCPEPIIFCRPKSGRYSGAERGEIP